MKTNESLLHKGMRAIVQSTLRREANEPCHVCWTYQPHRPESPCRNRRIKSKTSLLF